MTAARDGSAAGEQVVERRVDFTRVRATPPRECLHRDEHGGTPLVWDDCIRTNRSPPRQPQGRVRGRIMGVFDAGWARFPAICSQPGGAAYCSGCLDRGCPFVRPRSGREHGDFPRRSCARRLCRRLRTARNNKQQHPQAPRNGRVRDASAAQGIVRDQRRRMCARATRPTAWTGEP